MKFAKKCFSTNILMVFQSLKKTFYFQGSHLIQEKVYFYDFRTSKLKFTWVPIYSPLEKLKEVLYKNESVLKQYSIEKDSVRELYR